MRFLFLSVLFSNILLSQYSWQPMPNAPITENKHDDVFFISSTSGWLVTAVGEIWKTTDGGNSWQLKKTYSGIRLRCVSFADSLRGWVGKFQIKGSDLYALLQTTDGGETWTEVKNIPSPAPQGMCGLFTNFDPFIYGCGRYAGPPIFIKSTDGGTTWTSKDLSLLASMLIDIHFFTPDSGIIVGARTTQTGEKGVILQTTDGGESWNILYTTRHSQVWCWKISFPTREVGYVSLQTFQDSVFFLKTTNGGKTWNENLFLKAGGSYSPQAIGFVSEHVGWIGAYPRFGTLRSEATYKTTNGGLSWTIDPTSKNMNRMRWMNDTLGFAAGNTVYQYKKTVTNILESKESPQSFILEQNYPNPFNPKTTIKFSLPRMSFVSLRIFDLLGKEVAVLLQDDEMQEGNYSIPFTANDLSSGVYWYRLETGTNIQTRKMILVR